MKNIFCILLISLSVMLNAQNILKNSDISKMRHSTPSYWRSKGVSRGTRVLAVEKNNSYCLKLNGKKGANKKFNYWIQDNLKLIPGKDYTVTYSAKAKKSAKYWVYIEWARMTKDGKKRYAGNKVNKQVGTGKWETISFDFKYKKGLCSPFLAMRGIANEDYLFCDLSIHPQVAAIEKIITLNKLDSPVILVNNFKKDNFFTLSSSQPKAVIKQKLQKGYYSLFYTIQSKTLDSQGSFPWAKVSIITNDKKYIAEWDDALKIWQRKSFKFHIPKACDATIIFELKEQGAVNIKNMFLKQGKKAIKSLVDISFASPTYRKTFFKTAKPEIIGIIRKKDKKIKKFNLTIEDPCKKLIFRENYSFNANKVIFSTKLPNPKAGNYKLELIFFDANNKILESKVEKIVYCDKSWINIRMRKDNIFLLNNKAIFPMILWSCPQSTALMKSIRNAGFNMFASFPSTIVLRNAEKNDMLVIAYVHDLLQSATKIEDKAKWEKHVQKHLLKFVKSPALFAYMLCDEPAWAGMDVDELKKLYALIKKIDPSRPIFINAAPRKTIPELAEYAEACDIYGVDIYPVPATNNHSDLEDQSLSCVGKYTKKMIKTVENKKPIWMSLQGFAWAHYIDRKAKNAIYPTEHQLRYMYYDSLVHGAKGLAIWGTHYIVDSNVAYWDIILKVTGEIKPLLPILASDDFTKIKVKSSTSKVKLLARTYQNHLYLIAINSTNKSIRSKISFSEEVKELNILFEEGIQKTLNKSFKTKFKPYGVHVFTTNMNFHPLVKNNISQNFTSATKATNVFRLTTNANWIWYPGEYMIKDSKCLLKKTFNIDNDIQKASITITADDECILYVNGNKIAKNSGWNLAGKYDLSKNISKGKNVVMISARDIGGAPCGFLCELDVDTSKGKIKIISDETWKASKNTDLNNSSAKDWTKAEVIGKYGISPWGEKVFTQNKMTQ